MQKSSRFLVVVGLAASMLLASNAFALTCQQVRQLTAVYLKMHYSFNQFDDELSKRTLDFFIRSWDPGKLYFYKTDVAEFRSKYEKKLDDMVLAANCKAISDIINVYEKRFQERMKEVPGLIKAKHNFKKKEWIELDRKKTEFASNPADLKERWRKRIKFQLLQLKKTVEDIKKAQAKLNKRYQLAVERQNEQTTDRIYARFLNSFSSSLDPHSDYMSVEQLEDFRISTRLSLEGIGAVLRSEDGFTVIQSVVPGGAAWKNGKLKVDDKIIAVAQGKGTPVDVIDLDLRDVVKLIRGKGGTEVRLTVMREEKGKSQQIVFPINREKIQLTDRTAKGKTFTASVSEPGKKKARDLKIGVINLPSFYVDFEGQHNKLKNYRSSASDMQREIKRLRQENVDAVVLDLRTNGGGSLTESIKIAGLFFDKGPVVHIKESDGNFYPHSDKDGKTYYDGPLVVLISRQSASASEIFAGAIQDYGRGVIVGDSHTFGKGTVQNLNDIGRQLGATKVTISKFYRPSGSSTQLKGVASDITLPSLVDEIEIGEKHYDYALPWDVIKTGPHKKFNQVKPYTMALKKSSVARTAKDPAFKDIFDEIKEFQKNKAERTRVSLNEDAKENKKEEKKTAKKEEEERERQQKALVNDFDLDGDAHLQESVRVAADYVQLLNKRPLGKVKLPDVKVVKVAEVDKKKQQNKKGKKPPKAAHN